MSKRDVKSIQGKHFHVYIHVVQYIVHLYIVEVVISNNNMYITGILQRITGKFYHKKISVFVFFGKLSYLFEIFQVIWGSPML